MRGALLPALSLALTAAGLAGGCSGALYSVRDVSFGQSQETRPEPPLAGTKAQVLAALGPPGEVLPQAEGDLFVYRRRTNHWRVFDLHTGLAGLPRLSLYADLAGAQRDEALTVRFDRDGRVVDVARTVDPSVTP